MNSPSAALIWEIWRKNRWGFVLLLVLLAVCAGLSGIVVHLQPEVDRLVAASTVAHEDKQGVVTVGLQYSEEVSQATMNAQTWREGVLAWSAMLMGFSFLVVCAIFAGAEPHTARGFTGIPPRRFTLAVRTSELVGWPIVLGCATIVLLYFAWSRLVLPPLLPQKMGMPDTFLVVLFSTGLVAFQALVWTLPSFPRTRVCLIVILVLCLILTAAGAINEPTITGWATKAKLPLLPAGFAIVWLASVAGAWFGVRQQRRGGWASWKGWTAVEKVLHKLRPPPLGFGSPLRAQVWIEWRRNGRLALGVWLLMVVTIVIGDLLQRAHFSGSKSAGELLISTAVLPIPFWIAIAGLNLGRDGSSKALALSSFTATRPLNTGMLLLAKVLAGAAIWFFAAFVLVVSLFVLRVRHGGELNWTIDAVMLPVSLHIFVGILPLCLSGRIPGFPWSLLPLLLIYGLAVNAYTWFMHHQDYRELLFALLTTLLLLKLAVAFWGFRWALGLRLISARFVFGYVGWWLVATGGLFFLAWEFAARADSATDMIYLLPAAVLAVPLARIALAPLALAMNRHR